MRGGAWYELLCEPNLPFLRLLRNILAAEALAEGQESGDYIGRLQVRLFRSLESEEEETTF